MDHPAADRARLLAEIAGIGASIALGGVVYGLAATDAGLSPLDASVSSLVAFSGAAQFAALGALHQGLPWTVVLVTTVLLNARLTVYGTVLAPALARLPVRARAAMAHVLTDESFALASRSAAGPERSHVDTGVYWLAGLAGVYVPWNVGTLVGALAGGVVPDPAALGLDVVFPASMAGLAVGLLRGRREVVAAAAACAVAVPAVLALGPGIGVVLGALAGPAVALAFVPEPELQPAHPAEPAELAGPADRAEDAALAAVLAGAPAGAVS